MKELFHWTSTYHLKQILLEGRLTTTESNVGSPSPMLQPAGEHLGPDVVWLLDVPVLRFGHGLTMDPSGPYRMLHDKTEVRFTVKVDGAVPWTRWKPAEAMHPTWRKSMIRSGGGRDAVRHWWVIERDIPRAEWVEVLTPEGVLELRDA